jgi:hypothetical protein
MNAKRINRLLQIAYPLCVQIPRPKKHLSLIIHRGRIEAVGSNALKTHTEAQKKGYLFSEPHSELDAYLKVERGRTGLILFNVRFNRFGQLRLSRPCPLCMPWCSKCFDEIWYTTNEGVVLHGSSLPIINTWDPKKEKTNEKIHPVFGR